MWIKTPDTNGKYDLLTEIFDALDDAAAPEALADSRATMTRVAELDTAVRQDKTSLPIAGAAAILDGADPIEAARQAAENARELDIRKSAYAMVAQARNVGINRAWTQAKDAWMESAFPAFRDAYARARATVEELQGQVPSGAVEAQYLATDVRKKLAKYAAAVDLKADIEDLYVRVILAGLTDAKTSSRHSLAFTREGIDLDDSMIAQVFFAKGELRDYEGAVQFLREQAAKRREAAIDEELAERARRNATMRTQEMSNRTHPIAG